MSVESLKQEIQSTEARLEHLRRQVRDEEVGAMAAAWKASFGSDRTTANKAITESEQVRVTAAALVAEVTARALARIMYAEVDRPLPGGLVIRRYRSGMAANRWWVESTGEEVKS